MNSANHHDYRGVVKLEYAFSFAERPILCVRSSLAVPGSMTNVVRDGLGSWLRKMRRPVCPVPAPTAIKQVQGGGLVLSGTTGTARPSTVGGSGPIEGTTLGPRALPRLPGREGTIFSISCLCLLLGQHESGATAVGDGSLRNRTKICLVPQSADHTSNPYAYLEYILQLHYYRPLQPFNHQTRTKMPKSKKKARKNQSKTAKEKPPPEPVLTPSSTYGKLCFSSFDHSRTTQDVGCILFNCVLTA